VRPVVAAGSVVGGAGLLLGLSVRGALTLDLGIGRVMRPFGPVLCEITAPREVVFDVIASPYLGRTPRALRAKLEVWERGENMVLAAHHTGVGMLTATTLETVRFERPSRVDFRLVRGPVPHVAESFTLTSTPAGTNLTWEGEIGADFWALGRWWAEQVARVWEQAVRTSFDTVKTEAERRAGAS